MPVTFRPRDFALYLDGNDAGDGDASDQPRPQLVTGTWTVELIPGSTTLGLRRGLIWISGSDMDLLGSICLNRAIRPSRVDLFD